MRRFMVLPLTGMLLLAAAAPVAAGPNVHNVSGSGEAIYAEWYGEGVFGYANLGEEDGFGGFGDIYQESGEWVLCSPAGDPAPGEPEQVGPQPADTGPGEEYYGFVGTRTYGWTNDVTIELTRRLEQGTATGTIELYTESVDDCAGTYVDLGVAIVALRVDASAAGPLANFRGTGSYTIPSEFNGHNSYRGKERFATGTVSAGSVLDTVFEWGYMTQVTWMEHANG